MKGGRPACPPRIERVDLLDRGAELGRGRRCVADGAPTSWIGPVGFGPWYDREPRSKLVAVDDP